MQSTLLNPTSMTIADGTIYRIKSRDDYKNLLTGYKVVFQYKASAECAIDVNNAISIMQDTDMEYTILKCISPGCSIYFESPHTIDQFRKVWHHYARMDLYYMIESLDYVDDYTGKRYFEKYHDGGDGPENYMSDEEE
jgi:hypothetical protein